MEFIDKDEINEKINIIMRQTDYNEESSKQKLIEHNYDHIKVIKSYLGITEKKALPPNSLNQEIYKQIRHKLDDSMKKFNSEQEHKLKLELENIQKDVNN